MGSKTRCLYPMESSLDVASTKWPENQLVPNLRSLLSSFPVDGTSEYQLPLNSYETADYQNFSECMFFEDRNDVIYSSTIYDGWCRMKLNQ